MPAALNPRRRPLLGLAAAVVATALAVTGCSAGQQAQSVEQTSVVDGVAFEAGSIEMRDVGLLPPSGSSYAAGANAYLEGLIANTSASDDTLVSVSSPAASSVLFFSDGVTALLGTAPTPTASASTGSSGSATPTDGATAAPSDGSTPTDTASPTGTATATGSSSAGSSGAGSSGAATSSAAAAPSPETGIAVPAGESVQFGYTNQQIAIVFVGLTEALFPAQSIEVTFTFASGATATATVSVKLPVDRTLDAPTIDTHEEAGGGE